MKSCHSSELRLLRTGMLLLTQSMGHGSNAINLGTYWKSWTVFKFIRTYSNFSLLSDTLTWNTLYKWKMGQFFEAFSEYRKFTWKNSRRFHTSFSIYCWSWQGCLGDQSLFLFWRELRIGDCYDWSSLGTIWCQTCQAAWPIL